MILLIVVFHPLGLCHGAGGESSSVVTVLPICRGANMIIACPLPWGLFLKRPTSVTLVVVSLPLFWCEVYHWFESVAPWCTCPDRSLATPLRVLL